MTEPSPEEKSVALAEWRDRHWDELDKCLAVAVSIRDSDAEPRDRNEANKTILRMLGGLSTRPSDSAAKKPIAKSKDSPISDPELESIEALIRA